MWFPGEGSKKRNISVNNIRPINNLLVKFFFCCQELHHVLISARDDGQGRNIPEASKICQPLEDLDVACLGGLAGCSGKPVAIIFDEPLDHGQAPASSSRHEHHPREQTTCSKLKKKKKETNSETN
jgi:hypothetical protein